MRKYHLTAVAVLLSVIAVGKGGEFRPAKGWIPPDEADKAAAWAKKYHQPLAFLYFSSSSTCYLSVRERRKFKRARVLKPFVRVYVDRFQTKGKNMS